MCFGTLSSIKAVPKVYRGVPPTPSSSCPRIKTYRYLWSEEFVLALQVALAKVVSAVWHVSEKQRQQAFTILLPNSSQSSLKNYLYWKLNYKRMLLCQAPILIFTPINISNMAVPSHISDIIFPKRNNSRALFLFPLQEGNKNEITL